MLASLVLAALASAALDAQPPEKEPEPPAELAQLHSGLRASVKELDARSLQRIVAKHRRFIVMMHFGDDEATRAFQPWLFAIANMVPEIPIGRVDLSSKERGAEMAGAFQVPSGATQLKLFIRDKPKGERIVDYRGPLQFEPLLGWVRAAISGEEHEHSAPGVEPPSSGAEPPRGGGGMMNKLPESVRTTAKTMIMESRLQKILRQQGGGKVEQYDVMVGRRYEEVPGSGAPCTQSLRAPPRTLHPKPSRSASHVHVHWPAHRHRRACVVRRGSSLQRVSTTSTTSFRSRSLTDWRATRCARACDEREVAARAPTYLCACVAPQVREALLKSAPLHIREEIEAEVALGDLQSTVG